VKEGDDCQPLPPPVSEAGDEDQGLLSRKLLPRGFKEVPCKPTSSAPEAWARMKGEANTEAGTALPGAGEGGGLTARRESKCDLRKGLRSAPKREKADAPP
jgi:hypothetical protein